MRLADRFALEREIGSGGMARVYLGRDEVLDRPVAVKVLKPMHGDSDIGIRFRREGRTAARLSHPNIVQVYDAGKGDLEGSEVSYIVMEYLSGGDLKELIDASEIQRTLLQHTQELGQTHESPQHFVRSWHFNLCRQSSGHGAGISQVRFPGT